MNTFKTTACLLSLVTAGFAIEDRTPQRTPVRLGNTFAEVATPVQDFAALNIGSPVHHLAPQQLFPVTPNGGQQNRAQFTPQDRMVQNQTPRAPGRVRRESIQDDMSVSAIDRLASALTLSLVLSPKKSNFSEVTILDPNGTIIYTTKKKRGKSSSRVQKCGSPSGVEEVLSFFDRLETSGRTPFAPMFATSGSTPSVHPSVLQFTTGKSMAFISSVDPVLEDNGYSSEEEIIEEESNISIVSAQDTSMGSFVIRGANPLRTNGMDNSMTDDSSFVIRGANLLGTNGGDDSRSFHGEETGHLNDVSIISEEGQEGNDSLNTSVISYAGSETGNYLDMSNDDIDFSDEA